MQLLIPAHAVKLLNYYWLLCRTFEVNYFCAIENCLSVLSEKMDMGLHAVIRSLCLKDLSSKEVHEDMVVSHPGSVTVTKMETTPVGSYDNRGLVQNLSVATLREGAPSYCMVKKWAAECGRESLENDRCPVTTQETIDKTRSITWSWQIAG